MHLTIFTPTYNRAYILSELFKSLQNQNAKDFEWLIVDDGSTDNTREVVEQFRQDADFPIRYIYQENQGKHVAINTALKNTEADYFMTVDSDDRLIASVIDVLKTKLSLIEIDSEIAAISSPIKYLNSNQLFLNQTFDDEKKSTPFEMRLKFNVHGEFTRIFKTSILKQYPYPVFEGEKFMPESVVYNRINLRYYFLYTPIPFVEGEYMPDGLTARAKNLYLQNPKGVSLSYREKMNNKKIPFPERLKMVLAYWDYESKVNTSFFSKLLKIKSNSLKIAYINYKIKKTLHI